MASSGIRRKIDDLGRVVIPAGMRRTLGLREGDAVEVTVEGERVVLAKPRDACVFCGREEEQLTGFRGRLVCRDCLTSLGSVDERLRATDLADRPTAAGARREVADLPDWDAPSAPPAPGAGSPADPAPAATSPPAPTPAPTPAPGPAPAPEPRAPATPEPAERSTDREDDDARPPRRPPYDPASTTAW
jgi:AbrB family transcriptional regulator, transcriptional pleiotropic regulator of transition state genes